jgi:hypothetical protein
MWTKALSTVCVSISARVTFMRGLPKHTWWPNDRNYLYPVDDTGNEDDDEVADVGCDDTDW